MNLKKGFFRLTLVLSILVGIMTPFCHEWIFDEKSVVEVSFPLNFSLQEKLKGSFLNPRVEDYLALCGVDHLRLSKIKLLNIQRQLRDIIISEAKRPPKEADKWEKYRVYRLSFKVGWRELSLLALVGFASTWVIHLFIRWVVIAFIVRGFKEKGKPIGG